VGRDMEQHLARFNLDGVEKKGLQLSDKVSKVMRKLLNYLLGEEVVTGLKNNPDVVFYTWIALSLIAIALSVFAPN
jgi:hypothetical protein